MAYQIKTINVWNSEDEFDKQVNAFKSNPTIIDRASEMKVTVVPRDRISKKVDDKWETICHSDILYTAIIYYEVMRK